MGYQKYKLPSAPESMKNLDWSVYDFLSPQLTFGDLPKDPEVFMAIYEYVENCTVGRSVSTEGGKTHASTSLGKPDMYMHKLPVDSLSPVLQGIYLLWAANCIVVSSKMKFFFPAKTLPWN